MAITTIQLIGEHNGLEERIAKKAFGFRVEAVEEMKHLISETSYNVISTNTSHRYYEVVLVAESLLCYYFSLQTIGNRPDQNGGFVTSTGFNDSRTSVLSPVEVGSIARSVYARAKVLLKYLLVKRSDIERPHVYEGLTTTSAS